MTGRGLLTRRDARSGATAVEFGIVGGVFTLLLVALLEMGWQLAIAGALEFGVREAALQCTTGAPCTRESMAVDIARRGVILNPANLGVLGERHSVEAWPTTRCRAIDPGGGTVAPVAPSALSRFCVTYRQPWLTPVGIAWSGGRGAVDHDVIALVRNEPF